jgi:hypothetical protein
VTDFEPLFVLIDEYTEFLNSLRSWYAGVKVKGDPTVPRTLDEVASILRLGRSGRVHLIKTAQRPDIALFGGAAAGEMRRQPRSADVAWSVVSQWCADDVGGTLRSVFRFLGGWLVAAPPPA